MSRIYFHTPSGTAEVRGNERAYFGAFCNNLTWGILHPYAQGNSPEIRRVFPPEHYIHGTTTSFENTARIALAVGSDTLRLNDRVIEPFALSLNTAFALGNDAVKLAARIHGQCEIHCWVNGENRRWIASIIQQGINSNFYRSDMGWDKVVELLISNGIDPVVLSYSVCESFPNRHVATWVAPIDEDGEPDIDAWYDLPDDERWRLAFEGLTSSGGGLELTPDKWSDFYFEDGYTALNLVNDLETK